MKLTMLGTGNAVVTECYNTCFVLQEGERFLLVDGGGGNTLLHQLKAADIDWKAIREIFVTHAHMDHVMGIFWMIRMICQNMKRGSYEGEAVIYCHAELAELLNTVPRMMLSQQETAFLGDRLKIVPVEDGEERTVLGHHRMRFFDICSTKAKQFGFTLDIRPGEKLACCGDEPFYQGNAPEVQGSQWLLHEAFCLESQAELFHPYEKHHSTVADACRLAQRMQIPNLLLYHTEDRNLARRQELYRQEGQRYYSGNLLIPEDLDSILL